MDDDDLTPPESPVPVTVTDDGVVWVDGEVVASLPEGFVPSAPVVLPVDL